MRSIPRERQKHGFQYELQTICKYNLKKADSYTCPFDAYYKDIPVQIKCIKYGSCIEMGDYIRNKSKKNDFILIIGLWDGKKENIIQEIVLFINHQLFKKHLQFHLDDEMLYEMKTISNSRLDDLSWKRFCFKYKNKWPRANIMQLRFKRDHKRQKRIQCAIPWKSFNNQFCHLFSKFNLNV